jgi:hypothetical protein
MLVLGIMAGRSSSQATTTRSELAFTQGGGI